MELNKQYKEMTESKLQTRDITQEFVLRSKLRDLHNACKVCSLTKNLFFFLNNKSTIYLFILYRRNGISYQISRKKSKQSYKNWKHHRLGKYICFIS